MAESGWRMVDGGERMADSGWRRAEGGERRADGGERRADGGERIADSGWRIADGGERRAEGGWRMAESGKPENTETFTRRVHAREGSGFLKAAPPLDSPTGKLLEWGDFLGADWVSSREHFNQLILIQISC